jgi:pimeloyl-ACP methyl ester carboxylesterase
LKKNIRSFRSFRSYGVISFTAIVSLFFSTLAFSGLSPANAAQGWTLANYQAQRLNWSSCFQGFYCASFKVPVDYDHVNGDSFTLQILKHQANTPNKRMGSLIVNPGGPGGSGVDYAYNADTDVSKKIEDLYDLVGFDPRGVNMSQSIRCLTDKEEDGFLDNFGSIENDADLKGAIAGSQMIANACAKAAGNKLAHYSTLETAKDMEILRILLHEPLLNYLGKSYGTYLGTLYAALYPKTTGKIILDGAIDPNVPARDQNLSQSLGFETALKSFLSKNPQFTYQQIQDFLHLSRTKPLKMRSGRTLTQSLAFTGIVASLYEPVTGWPDLSNALAQVFNGNNPTGLMHLADGYNERDTHGHYISNQTDIAEIISCLDVTDTRPVSALVADAPNFAKAAPIFGPFLAYSGLPCRYWKAPPTKQPVMKNLKTNPLLVIGTTRDPATPYAWALGLHKELLNSTLITLNADGHTGANRGSSCVDAAMNTYLLTGKVPSKDLTCALDAQKIAVMGT